jgi:predicted metal-dependent hydrolase
MAEPAVIDAVVVHELCHLRHPDHGPRFRRLVSVLCPDHDLRMTWLRNHGEELDL